MSKHYIVLGSSFWHELDNRWIVASFSNRSKAEEWCERCNYYGQWVSKMEEAAFEERCAIDRNLSPDFLEEEKIDWNNAAEVDAFYPATQWKWAIEGSTVQGDLCLDQDIEKDLSEENYEAAYDCVMKEGKAELGWMLNPYDPKIAENISQGISYEVVEVEDDPLLPSDGVERDVRVLTLQALRDPQPGDRFHEMYSYFVYVVHREQDEVWYCEANPPCSFPEDAKLVKTTVQKMLDHFTHVGRNIGIVGKRTAWVRLSERGNDVTGWNREYYKMVVDERREK